MLHISILAMRRKTNRVSYLLFLGVFLSSKGSAKYSELFTNGRIVRSTKTNQNSSDQIKACCCLPVIMWFLFGEVSSSSGCFGWATLFYCGTP